MRQRTGIIKLVRMPVMASFAPTLTATLPYAYAFDATTARALLPILKIHGIAVEQLDAPASVTAQVVRRGHRDRPRTVGDVAHAEGL